MHPTTQPRPPFTVQFPDKDAAAVRAIDARVAEEENEEVRRFQRRRDIHDQVRAFERGDGSARAWMLRAI
jgi:hypothetical protein